MATLYITPSPCRYLFLKEEYSPMYYRLKSSSSRVHRDKEIYLRLYFSGSPISNKFSLFLGACSAEAGLV
jgi:hypothetical protein